MSTNYIHVIFTDGKIDFASFLEVMHEHCNKENTVKEIIAAFRAHDKEGRGYIQASELRNVLLNLGERLSRREGRTLIEMPNLFTALWVKVQSSR